MSKKRRKNSQAKIKQPDRHAPPRRRLLQTLGHHPVVSTIIAAGILASLGAAWKFIYLRPSLSVVGAPFLEEWSSYHDADGAVIHQWVLSDPMRGSCRIRRFATWSTAFSDLEPPHPRFSLKLIIANNGRAALNDVITTLSMDSIGSPSMFATSNVQMVPSIRRNLNGQVQFQAIVEYLQSGDTAVVTLQQDDGWSDRRFGWGEVSYSSRETERRTEGLQTVDAKAVLDAERRLHGGDMLLPKPLELRYDRVGEHWIYTALQENENDSRLQATGTCGYVGPERELPSATTLPPLDSVMLPVADPPTTNE